MVSYEAYEYGWGHYLSSFIVNNKLHTFGADGQLQNIHTIYDLQTGEMQGNPTKSVEDIECLAVHGLLFVESQQKILFFGGDLGETVLIYDVVNDSYDKLLNVTSTWDDYTPAGVVSTDEKYAILVSESFQSEDEDTFVLNLNDSQWSVKNSSNMLPWQYPQSIIAFMTTDMAVNDIVINGYLRRCWKQDDFTNVSEFPYELIRIIIEYYTAEYIHVARQYHGHHYKILLEDILYNYHI